MSSNTVHGHSEHDKSRFVATNGQDKGLCDNRARPCQTISYAIQHANKGDKVLVAAGHYNITEPSELLYLVSQTVPVIGGYNTLDLYQSQNPNLHTTTLSGVPLAYAADLYQSGFNVIVDTKGQQTDEVTLDSALLQQLSNAQPTADCVNGQADAFPCNSMDLLSHIPLSGFSGNPTSANDVWGHIDLNDQREYAIIGLRNSVAVVDVSEPESPSIVGQISGPSTTWRDIKVYQRYNTTNLSWEAYAYVTADNAAQGTWVIDLNQLPESISLAATDRTDLSAHNVYISNVDYSLGTALPNTTAQLHIAGSNAFGGAFRSYSLESPTDLTTTFIPASSSRADYTHDMSSLNISDQRATDQCPNADDGNCLLILDFNEQQIRLSDHSEPSSRTVLSNTTYPNVAYVHFRVVE